MLISFRKLQAEFQEAGREGQSNHGGAEGMSNVDGRGPDLEGASAAEGVTDEDLQTVELLRSKYKAVRAELNKVIVGQDEVLEQILVSIFARGHCLLVGVPGLAKTLSFELQNY